MNITKKIIQNNFNGGRNGYKIKRIILHTYASKGTSLYNWFNNPDSNASAHYAVFKDGTVEQYVEDQNTAWHAGTKEQPNNNWESIGIEHQDDGVPADPVRTEALYKSAAELVAMLCEKYDIPCKYLDENNKRDSGISLHRFYASDGRSCPGGLDYNRIIQDANKLLNNDMNNIKNLYNSLKNGLWAVVPLKQEILKMDPKTPRYSDYQKQIPLLESSNVQDVIRGVDNVGRILNGKPV